MENRICIPYYVKTEKDSALIFYVFVLDKMSQEGELKLTFSDFSLFCILKCHIFSQAFCFNIKNHIINLGI